MKTVVALIGTLMIAFGTLAGIASWYLLEFYLPASDDWDGPAYTINTWCWFLNILMWGMGGICIGVATMLPSPREHDFDD
ncbi:MAG: hypothetical protein KDA69_20805 [Planctomycetaceae bacterium]|nr:hypothetical protein [Planctomycetaceae bacterium]MCA9046783.1 hypothetical protein [Planctomycetaceae bacterium]MCB9952358.1 hypothetical protein [Planctomycetaceae bacterium]